MKLVKWVPEEKERFYQLEKKVAVFNAKKLSRKVHHGDKKYFSSNSDTVHLN